MSCIEIKRCQWLCKIMYQKGGTQKAIQFDPYKITIE